MRFVLALALAPALALAACGSDFDLNLPSFQDPGAAPGPIQAAAGAVVKIHLTGGSSATGSFVSADGLLLTNNHVLGVDECPREGCFVQLSFGLQRGMDHSASDLYAVPVAVDVGLDMALVQILSAPGGVKFTPPTHLTIAERDANALLGTKIHVIGHPNGRLKKWSSGQVVDAFGEWFKTSAYSLPGSSGSPILDEQGQIVGLLHRASVSADQVTGNGYDADSLASASASLVPAMKAPLPPEVLSLSSKLAASDILDRTSLFANAHVAVVNTATIGSAPNALRVLDVLGQACDAGLARMNYRAPEDLSAALAPCAQAQMWIECRSDGDSLAGMTSCPPDGEQWKKRFAAVNAASQALNGQFNLSILGFGSAALEPNKAQGRAQGAALVTAALNGAHAPLDFSVANILAGLQVGSYAEIDVAQYILHYHDQPRYDLAGTSIPSAALWLLSSKRISRDQALGVMKALYEDRAVTTATRLYAEQQLYFAGILQ